MPTYDYRCDANGRVVEVSHRMSEKLGTWGELCERAHLDCGDTPADAPVQRLATGGNVIGSSTLGSGFDPAPACGAGGCGNGMCGLN
jgi:predicted nucleic acid-binding Zn ribbon protein